MKKLFIFISLIILTISFTSCEKQPNYTSVDNKSFIVTDGYINTTIRENGTGNYYNMQFYFFTEKYPTNTIVTNGGVGDPIDLFTRQVTTWEFKNRLVYINGLVAATYKVNGAFINVMSLVTKNVRNYKVIQRGEYYYFTGPETRSGFKIRTNFNEIDSLVDENNLRNYFSLPFNEDYAIFGETTLLFKEQN